MSSITRMGDLIRALERIAVAVERLAPVVHRESRAGIGDPSERTTDNASEVTCGRCKRGI